MNIGYACMALGVPDTQQKTCRLKNAGEQTLKRITAHNLDALKNILIYNVQNNIRLFRISSDIIPFGSHQINTIPWQELFAREINDLGRIVSENEMRVSMHPGQYTVLNSPNGDVIKNAVADLDYHAAFLDALGVGSGHKIILHIGGIYGNKAQAVERFIAHYRNLNSNVKQRLVIENDEKCFSVEDVLSIAAKTGIPVVFDNLHHEVYTDGFCGNETDIIKNCAATWKKSDGVQKIHYAQQDALRKRGSHAQSIRIEEFMAFYDTVKNMPLDIMLEAKDKNISALKCINCVTSAGTCRKLEEEWKKYRHKVFENSPDDYDAIRRLIENKRNISAVAFYQMIEKALKQKPSQSSFKNSAVRLWRIFENCADEKEASRFFKYLNSYLTGKPTDTAVRNFLYRMAVKYHIEDLMNSYYFIL